MGQTSCIPLALTDWHAEPETISQMLEVVDDAIKKLYTKRYIVQFLFALRKSYCRSLTNDS